MISSGKVSLTTCQWWWVSPGHWPVSSHHDADKLIHSFFRCSLWRSLDGLGESFTAHCRFNKYGLQRNADPTVCGIVQLISCSNGELISHEPCDENAYCLYWAPYTTAYWRSLKWSSLLFHPFLYLFKISASKDFVVGFTRIRYVTYIDPAAMLLHKLVCRQVHSAIDKGEVFTNTRWGTDAERLWVPEA